MKEGKYIVFTDGTARVFENHYVHAWMSSGKPARSAGFFRETNGKIECYGESETMGLKAQEGDADIVAPYVSQI